MVGGLCIAVGDGAETFTAMIDQRAREGWSVGDRSVLCPFNKRSYYLEWVRGVEVDANWCLPERVGELVGSVWRRKMETDFKIVAPSQAICDAFEMEARLHQNMLNKDLEMTKRAVS